MEELYITSRTKPLVVSLSRLTDKKERDKTGLYIAEGFKLCKEACDQGRVRYAVLRQDRRQQEQYAALVKRCGGVPVVLSETVYEKITKDHSPDGILFVMEMESLEIPGDMTGERVCILDSIQDPGNVGTIIRTAAALGIDRVILHKCADVYNPKVIRATMGAFFRISVSKCSDLQKLIIRLQNAGQHAQERGLACAVRADQAVDRAVLDFRADVIDRRNVLKPLGRVGCRNHVLLSPFLSTQPHSCSSVAPSERA